MAWKTVESWWHPDSKNLLCGEKRPKLCYAINYITIYAHMKRNEVSCECQLIYSERGLCMWAEGGLKLASKK